MNELERELYKGARGYLAHYVAAVVERRRDRVFSGVKVRHANRYFIMTAAHCINDLAGDELDQLHVLTAERPLRMDPTALRAVSGMRRGSALDIGLLELSEDESRRLGGLWINSGEMGSGALKPGSGRPVCALGVPEARRESRRGDEPPSGRPWPVATATRVEWLAPSCVITKVAERDAPEEVAVHVGEADLLLELPDAVEGQDEPPGSLLGMSGAGVFPLPLLKEGELWSPDDTRLAGILVERWPEERLMKCHRIEAAFGLLELHVEEEPPRRRG